MWRDDNGLSLSKWDIWEYLMAIGDITYKQVQVSIDSPLLVAHSPI